MSFASMITPVLFLNAHSQSTGFIRDIPISYYLLSIFYERTQLNL